MVASHVKQLYSKYILSLNNVNSNNYKLSILIILIIGFFLRLYSLTVGEAYHSFAINDEIVAFDAAMKLASGEGSSWYLGPSMFSSGNAPGPLWTIFIIVIYKLGLNSIWGALFVMVFINSATVYLVYRLTSHFMTPTYTLFTTLLYATAPWVIYYSTGLYNPMPNAFLGAVLYLTLWNTINQDNTKMIFWVCVIAAAIPQFHMITLFYIPAILVVLWLSKSRINKMFFVLGIFAGISLYLPYVIGDALNGWHNTKLILSGEDKGFSFSVLKILTAPVTVLSNIPSDWVGREVNGFKGYQAFGNHSFGTYYLLLVINLLGLLLYFYIFFKFITLVMKSALLNFKAIRLFFAKDQKLLFLGVLIIIPLLLFLLTGRNYATRYTILMFPLLFMLPGIIIKQMANREFAKKLMKVILLLSVFNIYMMITFYNYQNFMIYNSDAFMPSFNRLDDIKKSIIAVIGKNNRIDVALSKEIKKLTTGQRKLFIAVEEYFNVYHVSTDRQGAVKSTRNIFIQRGDENSVIDDTQRVIFSSPAIKILASSSNTR